MTENYPAAYFVENPSRIDNLKRPHFIEQQQTYVIVKVITLARINYENFITDLRVDRWFIEKNKRLCQISESGVWSCILVQEFGRTDGILVMPEALNYPKWAAYMHNGDGQLDR